MSILFVMSKKKSTKGTPETSPDVPVREHAREPRKQRENAIVDIPPSSKVPDHDREQAKTPFVLDKKALDEKYPDPKNFGAFKVFFGKFKGKTFSELAKDAGYCDFVLSVDAKSSNMYLLQRYIKFLKESDQKIE